jgi:hypothetical protein
MQAEEKVARARPCGGGGAGLPAMSEETAAVPTLNRVEEQGPSQLTLTPASVPSMGAQVAKEGERGENMVNGRMVVGQRSTRRGRVPRPARRQHARASRASCGVARRCRRAPWHRGEIRCRPVWVAPARRHDKHEWPPEVEDKDILPTCGSYKSDAAVNMPHMGFDSSYGPK